MRPIDILTNSEPTYTLIEDKGDSIIISRNNVMTGDFHEHELPMTRAHFEICWEAWRGGSLIQHAFNNLSIIDREFVMTGLTPADQDEIFLDPESFDQEDEDLLWEEYEL